MMLTSRASSGMWVASRSEITDLFYILTRHRSNKTKVILREKDRLEEGSVAGKRTPAINYIPIRMQNMMGGPGNDRLNLKEVRLARKEESKMEEQEDARQKRRQSRSWRDKLAKIWAAKLSKSLPNWPTVMPGPGHF